MASFNLQIRPAGSLADQLASFPESAKSYFRRGYAALASVPQDKWSELIDYSIDSTQPHVLGGVDDRTLSEKLSVPRNDVRPLIASAALLCATAIDRDEAPDQIADVMSEAGLAGKSQVPVLAAFLGVVAANRPRIRQGLRSAALGVSNLPLVQSVRASIDIRVGFEENTVAAAVPVAIIFIGTDAPERRLWFQATEKQLERLVTEFQTALQRVREASGWASRSLKQEK